MEPERVIVSPSDRITLCTEEDAREAFLRVGFSPTAPLLEVLRPKNRLEMDEDRQTAVRDLEVGCIIWTNRGQMVPEGETVVMTYGRTEMQMREMMEELGAFGMAMVLREDKCYQSLTIKEIVEDGWRLHLAEDNQHLLQKLT